MAKNINNDILHVPSLPQASRIRLDSNIVGENLISCHDCERWWSRKSPVNFSVSHDFQLLDEGYECSSTHQAGTRKMELENIANQFQNKEINMSEKGQFLNEECVVNEQNAGCQTEFFGMHTIQTESMLQLVRKVTKAVKASSKSFEDDMLVNSPNVNTSQCSTSGEDINKIPKCASLPVVESEANIENVTRSTVTDPTPNCDRMDSPIRMDVASNSRDMPDVRSTMESHAGISDVMDLPLQINSADDKDRNNEGELSEYHKSLDVSPSSFICPKYTLSEMNCKKLVGDIGCREFFQPLIKYENVAAILCGSSTNNHADKYIRPLLNDFMHEYKLGKLEYKFEGDIFRQVIEPTISPNIEKNQSLNDEEITQFEAAEAVYPNIAPATISTLESGCQFHHTKGNLFQAPVPSVGLSTCARIQFTPPPEHADPGDSSSGTMA